MTKKRQVNDLGGLLGDVSQLADDEVVQEIDLKLIDVFPDARQENEDDEQTIASLAHSIEKNGLIHAVVVREKDDGRFELAAGRRRRAAIESLGWTAIPAVVRELDDAQMHAVMMAENIDRKNFTQIELARQLQRDLAHFGSIEAVCRHYGKSRSWYSKHIALLDLPPETGRLVGKKGSADVEVIGLVRQIEKIDPVAAATVVDEIIEQRGSTNARRIAAAGKARVKTSKNKASVSVPAPADEPGMLGQTARTDMVPGCEKLLKQAAEFAFLKKNKGKAAVFSGELTRADLTALAEELQPSFFLGKVKTPSDVFSHLNKGYFATTGAGAFRLTAYMHGLAGREYQFESILETVMASVSQR